MASSHQERWRLCKRGPMTYSHVKFDESRAQLYHRLCDQFVYAALVRQPAELSLEINRGQRGGTTVVTGPFYGFFEETTAGRRIYDGMEQDKFEVSYNPLPNKPNAWRHVPMLAQQVTRKQLDGTDGALYNIRPDGKYDGPLLVHEDCWLVQQPWGWIISLPHAKFHTQYVRAL